MAPWFSGRIPTPAAWSGEEPQLDYDALRRVHADEQVFWFLAARGSYVRHKSELPMMITWRPQHALPVDLFVTFAQWWPRPGNPLPLALTEPTNSEAKKPDANPQSRLRLAVGSRQMGMPMLKVARSPFPLLAGSTFNSSCEPPRKSSAALPPIRWLQNTRTTASTD